MATFCELAVLSVLVSSSSTRGGEYQLTEQVLISPFPFLQQHLQLLPPHAVHFHILTAHPQSLLHLSERILVFSEMRLDQVLCILAQPLLIGLLVDSSEQRSQLFTCSVK